MVRIQTLSIGQPATYKDDRGQWTSGILKRPVTEPVYLDESGHAGDQVADTKNHGTPDQAVCAYPLAHYHAWLERYGAEFDDVFVPGTLGENWTLVGGDETSMCIGSTYEVGSAIVQVSGPRYPCNKQERITRAPGFLAEVRRTLRTGIYLRVLQPGEVEVGDALELIDCPHPLATVKAVAACLLGDLDLTVADLAAELPELNEFWRFRIAERLAAARSQPALFDA